MKITNVLIEYLDNPIGIDIVNPRITWNMEGAMQQQAFEIKYTINGETHHSELIYTDKMNYVFKDDFHSRDIVEFQIFVTNEQNEKQTSEKHYFEFGLLQKEDFKAKWIAGNYRVHPNKRYPVDCFAKDFKADDIQKARLYISACGLYRAKINDSDVTDAIFTPGSTDYHQRTQYQTFDVTGFIKENNRLEIELADGWYRGSIGAKGRRNTYGKQTQLWCQLELTHTDGNIETLCSNSSFLWCNNGPIRFADLKDGETVDFNFSPDYASNAVEVKMVHPLCAGNNVFVKEHEHFKPCSITKKCDYTLYEFPQNLAGYITLKCRAHQGNHIDLCLGELLDEEGDVTLKNIQCKNRGHLTPLQEIHIVCKEGVNEYRTKFFFGGFRYAQMKTKGMVLETEIESIAVYSDFKMLSAFECSNPLINTFYQNTIWSLKSNSIDIPTDCPTRERMGWTGDSQVFFNTAAYLCNYASFARKHVRDVYDEQQKNGCLPQIAPYSNEDWYMNAMNGSVGWADVGILIPYRFYRVYGDKRLLENHYKDMSRYMDFMLRRCGRAKGLYSIYAKPLHLSKENRKYQVNTGQSYGEWAEPSDVKAMEWIDMAQPHPEESMAYTVYMLNLMLEINRILNRKDNNERYTEYRDGIQKAYQELVGKKEHTLDTDRQAKLVRPLYLHLLNKQQEDYAKKRLIEALDHYGWRLGTGFLSTPFILDVLKDIDGEYAYRLLENERMPGWLYMAKNSTGTIWEGWEGPNSQNGIASLNHYSKGAMVEWLFDGMCGINVVEENTFEISPLIGGSITYAKAQYQSIYGKIAISWKKESDCIVYDLTVPSNTKAVFKDVHHHETVLCSGDYHFTIKL